MKITRIALLTLLLGAVAGVAFAISGTAVGLSLGPSSRPTVNLGFFYDDLAPYGNWVQTPSNGWVWTPLNVAPSWRPYENGHWASTDQGWTWISDEPFGWATYHYGRWYDDPTLGWAWVPGDEWAPSWVTFQEGPDYIGWAPLPPSVRLVSGFNRVALPPADFVFVPDREFLAPNLASFVVPEPRLLPIFRTTRNVTAFRFAGDRVFVEGLPVTRFARFGRVPTFRLADVGAPLRLRAPRIQGDRIAFFRPVVTRTFVQPPSLRPAARRSVVNLADFQKVRGRGRLGQAPPPWAPAWGRRGLAPGQLKHANAVAPPRNAVRVNNGRPVRARTVRELQAARLKALPRQHGRPAIRSTQRVRPGMRMQQARPVTRMKRVQAAPMRHLRTAPRMQRIQMRPARQSHVRPGPSMRQMSRVQARPGPRQFRQAHPMRQQQARQQMARPQRQQQARPQRQHRPPQ